MTATGRQALLFPNETHESVALSVLVKAIRLRRPHDAVVWLNVLWNAGQRPRTRAQRRILVSAAEDNLNIAVMQAVSGWFNSSSRHQLPAAVEAVLRIVSTPNWYATDRGRTYIRRWRKAELTESNMGAASSGELVNVMENAVKDRDDIRAMHAFNTLYERDDWDRYALARFLSRLATELGNEHASEITRIFSANLSCLWTDTNYSGQALYTLIEGPLSDDTSPEVSEEKALQLIAHARDIGPVAVPLWCLDGIHTKGNDPRFSGVLKHMAIACDAYERFGRLDPDDDFSLLSNP